MTNVLPSFLHVFRFERYRFGIIEQGGNSDGRFDRMFGDEQVVQFEKKKFIVRIAVQAARTPVGVEQISLLIVHDYTSRGKVDHQGELPVFKLQPFMELIAEAVCAVFIGRPVTLLENEISLNPDQERDAQVQMIDELWTGVKDWNPDQSLPSPDSLHTRMIEYFKKSLGNAETHFRVRVDLGFGDEEGEADGILYEGRALRIMEFKGEHDEVDKGIGQLLRYRTLFLQGYGGNWESIRMGLVCTEITPAQHAVCHELGIKLWLYGHVLEHCSIETLHIQYPDTMPWSILIAQVLFEKSTSKDLMRYPSVYSRDNQEPDPEPDGRTIAGHIRSTSRRRAIVKLKEGYQPSLKHFAWGDRIS